jgi:hypothetical protein
MKKLHKKLEKVAEHIDYTHANQLRLLKELSIACQHYELAAHLREYERHAEKSLAESSKFIKLESALTPLDKVIERNGWKVHDTMRNDLIEEGKKDLEEQAKSLFCADFKEKQEEPELLVNSIKTPDGTILTSRHRHDFVCHEDTVTGKRICLDGGLEYRRVTGTNYEDMSVHSNDPFEKIRVSLARLGRGKNFDKPAKWYTLNEMNDNWLAELITWIEANQPDNKYKKYYLQEIEYRKEHGITVAENED